LLGLVIPPTNKAIAKVNKGYLGLRGLNIFVAPQRLILFFVVRYLLFLENKVHAFSLTSEQKLPRRLEQANQKIRPPTPN
jgi:hypothetical protein